MDAKGLPMRIRLDSQTGPAVPTPAGETSPGTRPAVQEGGGKPGALTERPDGTALTDQLITYLSEGASFITGRAHFFV
jgi:hypothetical protein